MSQSSCITTVESMKQATCKSAGRLVGAQRFGGSNLRSSLWFFDNNRVKEACNPVKVDVLNQGGKGRIKMSPGIPFEIPLPMTSKLLTRAHHLKACRDLPRLSP